MLKELAVIRLSHAVDALAVGFAAVHVGFEDLHVGHHGNHFLLGEDPLGLKSLALVGAGGQQEQAGTYHEKVSHSQLIAHIGEELDAHQAHFFFIVFVFAQLAQGGLYVVGLCLLEIGKNVFLMIDVDVFLDEVVDVQMRSRRDDALDFAQQLVEFKTFAVGNVVQWDFLVDVLDDADFQG